MASSNVNISLPEALRDYVEERVASGSFADVSDFVRALIREDRARWAKSGIEMKLLEGLSSGPPVEADDAYWTDLKSQVRVAGIGQKGRK